MQIEISETARWYCAVTNPNCQTRAELGMYALGFRTFVPKIRKWVSHARIKKAVERPLLGRYIFVEVDHPRQSFGTVRAVNGIEGLVGVNGDPSVIPRRWVENFIQRYMAGEWDEVASGAIPLGARVCVMEGEWNDVLATVTSVKGREIRFKPNGSNIEYKARQSSVRAA